MALEVTSLAMALSLVALFLIPILFLKIKGQRHLPPSPPALPIVGHLHLLSPLIHRSFAELSSRYGPFISLKLGSARCVVASTPELAKELLKANELAFSSRMHSLAIERLSYNSSFSFGPYATYWKFIKKLTMSELLGSQALSKFSNIRKGELRRFLWVLHQASQEQKPVNITQELLKLTNNVISLMMLGLRCAGTESEAYEATVVVCEATRILGAFNVSDFIWFCRNLDLQGLKKRTEEIHRRYDAWIEKVISEREEVRRKTKKEGFEAKDFFDSLLDVMEADKSEMKLTRNHVKALIFEIFIGATDTSATSLDYVLAELINHPLKLEIARKEIDQVVGRNRLVEESDSPNLPYIQAIIKETLRLHPPVPIIPRKSTEECKVSNFTIPTNTLLFVNIWSIGRDPNYWEKPLEFLPERFLESVKGKGLGGIDIRGQHFQLLPFGTGRRGCPGISLAMQALPKTLAAVIQCFDLQIPCVDNVSGDHNLVDMSERPGITVPREHDLICVPKLRSLKFSVVK